MRAPACPLRPGPVASAGPTGYSAAMCAKIARQRADQLVFMQGLAESREQARRLIMAGKVALSSEGLPPGAPPQKVDKPGHPYPEGTVFELLGQERFVSRGAYKLLTILDNFKLDVSGMVCLDAGASTGGFTDCLLQHGATRVYAVDVGYGQLDWKLRSDPRVVCLERTNARYLTHEQVPDALDFASVDVSFISLKLILPPLNGLLKDGGHAACLVKPQFEAGREKVGKKGVVRDPAVHLEVLEHFLDHAGDAGFTVLGLTYSPIRGPEGNIEYLGYLEKGPRQERTFDLKALVDESHQTLKEHGEGGNP